MKEPAGATAGARTEIAFINQENSPPSCGELLCAGCPIDTASDDDNVEMLPIQRIQVGSIAHDFASSRRYSSKVFKGEAASTSSSQREKFFADMSGFAVRNLSSTRFSS